MSAGLLLAIAVAAGLLAAAVPRDGVRAAIPLLLAGAGLAAYAVVGAAANPLTVAHVADAPIALGIDGALVAATAGSSLLLVLLASLAAPERAAGIPGGEGGRGPDPAGDGSFVAPDPVAPLVPAAVGALAALAALAGAMGVLNGALMTPSAGDRALLVAPLVAIAAATAAAVLSAPLLASRAPLAPELETVRTGSRTLRAAVVAGAFALAGAAWLLADEGTVAADANGIAAALLLVASGFALLAGSVPFHALAVRAATAGSWLLLAARAAWLPAVLGLGAVAWEQHVLLPALGYRGLEATGVVAEARAAVAAAALVTLAGGALAATFRDDLRHLAVYAIVADWGLVLVALGSPDPAGSAAARDWIPLNALAKTALVGWCAAMSGTFATSRLDELAGWARRAPLLGVALVAIAAATFGFPGAGMLSLRPLLASQNAGLLGTAILAAAWLGLLPYLRLALVGVRTPSATVAAAAGELPVGAPARRGTNSAGGGAVRVEAWSARARSVAGTVTAAWTANAVPIAAVLALAGAVLALALAWAVGGRPTLVD